MWTRKVIRPIPLIVLAEGNYLELKLPVRAFATLITRRQSSPNWFAGAFQDWAQGIQAHSKHQLGWIKSLEPAPQLHAHAVLVAHYPIDCEHAEHLWRRIVPQRYKRAGEVKRFLPGICGLGYVLKQLGSSFEDTQFSDNLSAFVQGSGTQFYGRNAIERRQLRRIAKIAKHLPL